MYANYYWLRLFHYKALQNGMFIQKINEYIRSYDPTFKLYMFVVKSDVFELIDRNHVYIATNFLEPLVVGNLWFESQSSAMPSRGRTGRDGGRPRALPPELVQACEGCGLAVKVVQPPGLRANPRHEGPGLALSSPQTHTSVRDFSTRGAPGELGRTAGRAEI